MAGVDGSSRPRAAGLMPPSLRRNGRLLQHTRSERDRAGTTGTWLHSTLRVRSLTHRSDAPTDSERARCAGALIPFTPCAPPTPDRRATHAWPASPQRARRRAARHSPLRLAEYEREYRKRSLDGYLEPWLTQRPQREVAHRRGLHRARRRIELRHAGRSDAASARGSAPAPSRRRRPPMGPARSADPLEPIPDRLLVRSEPARHRSADHYDLG